MVWLFWGWGEVENIFGLATGYEFILAFDLLCTAWTQTLMQQKFPENILDRGSVVSDVA